MDHLPRHRPSVRQLEYLVAVADELHFGKAARRCAVTQPALSAQVRLVEELIGVQVFERSRRRVLVTPAGTRVIDHARRCLVAVDELVEDARRASEPLAGALRLGVIPTVAPYLLPAVLPKVRELHPKLELLLREEQTERIVEAVDSGALDLALLALPVDEAELVEVPLYDEPFYLVAHESHPLVRDRAARIPESALSGQEVLLLEDGHCLRAQALEVCRRAGAAGGRIQATSLNTLVQMVAGGLGVTLLPARAREVELRRGAHLACKAFRKPEPVRTIGLAWRPGSARESEYRLLAKTLKQAAKAE